MSFPLPFSPTTGATAGTTVKVTANSAPTSVSGQVDCTTFKASRMRVFNSGTVLVFVRLSAEAAPAASNKDIPLPAGTSIIVQNPVTQGKAGVAALSSTTTAADVYFTPGEGGS